MLAHDSSFVQNFTCRPSCLVYVDSIEATLYMHAYVVPVRLATAIMRNTLRRKNLGRVVYRVSEACHRVQVIVQTQAKYSIPFHSILFKSGNVAHTHTHTPTHKV